LTESEVQAHWAIYFEQLYQAIDPPAGELDVRVVTITIADHPINSEPPSLVERQAAVKQLKGGEASWVCGIHAELLKLVEMLYLCHCTQFCLMHRHHSNSLEERLYCPSLERKGCLPGLQQLLRSDTTISAGQRLCFGYILIGFTNFYLSTSAQSSRALHQRGQCFTVSLLFRP